MTNLLATIFLTVTTNWVDVARIQPINNGPPGNLLYYPASTQQRGTIITNTVARIKYDGREVDVILKSVEAPAVLDRTISDMDQSRFAKWGFSPN
jgi:hypothetical protein